MKLNLSCFLLSISCLATGGDAFAVAPRSMAVKHTSSTSLEMKRRGIIGSAIGSALASAVSKAQASMVSPKQQQETMRNFQTRNPNQPIADLPMIRLQLPRGGMGREYVAIQMKIGGQGPFDFMVDSGLTTELMTPHLQKLLSLKGGKSPLRGLAAGGETMGQSMVALNDASLCCGDFADGRDGFPLPQLRAIITDFPQEHIDPNHDVEGMIGMELLSLFDVDFDFENERVRFWPPGSADTGVIRETMVEIPAVVINETGLIGIRVTGSDARQPVLGFLDCGASFSCVNWKAAELLGLPADRKDAVYKKGPTIAAVGVDGKRIDLPTANKQLSFAGDIKIDPSTGRPLGFESPPDNFQPWDPVQLAVGDLPVFRSILGDGITPYDGPAVLIGLDILSQRRVILETGAANTRRRKVLVAPKNFRK